MRSNELGRADGHSGGSGSSSSKTGYSADHAFTVFVGALARGDESVESMANQLLAKLGTVLRREMHKRSLWSSSPAYVGIVGFSTWTVGQGRGIASPLDELLQDCYLFVFGDRLGNLINQLKVNSTIDGLVVFFVRNFLTQRQKLFDPLGHRIFEVTCQAARQAVADGNLFVLDGPEKIRNATLLGFEPGPEPSASTREELRSHVLCWLESLLPDLITAERGARRRVTGLLAESVSELESAGVRAFRFQDLLNVLKLEVRARWAALQRSGDQEVVSEKKDDGSWQLVRVFRPSTTADDLDRFEELVRCVSNRLTKNQRRLKTRDYLETLWNFLRRYPFGDSEALPSNRKLAAALKVPRERIPGLFQIIGASVSHCRDALSGTVVGIQNGRLGTGPSSRGHGG